jgi:hypothetical protein
MTRRALLLVPFAVMAQPDSADEVWDLLGAMSSALSEGNASEFLHAIDPALPGYAHVRDAITAAVRDYDIASTVDLVSNDGNDTARTLESDWQLSFVLRDSSVEPVRRRTRITLKFQRQSKRWRIVSLDPQSAFDPPR